MPESLNNIPTLKDFVLAVGDRIGPAARRLPGLPDSEVLSAGHFRMIGSYPQLVDVYNMRALGGGGFEYGLVSGSKLGPHFYFQTAEKIPPGISLDPRYSGHLVSREANCQTAVAFVNTYRKGGDVYFHVMKTGGEGDRILEAARVKAPSSAGPGAAPA